MSLKTFTPLAKMPNGIIFASSDLDPYFRIPNKHSFVQFFELYPIPLSEWQKLEVGHEMLDILSI